MSVLSQASAQVGEQAMGMQTVDVPRRVRRVHGVGADMLALAENAAVGQKYLPQAATIDFDVTRAKAEELALLLLPIPFAEGGDNRVWLSAGRAAQILQLQEDGTFFSHGREMFIADWSRERWELTGRLFVQRIAGDAASDAAEMGEDEFSVQVVIIICSDPCNQGPCCFMNCDDGRPCTIDSCQWGDCFYTDRECEDDGQFCNGVELPCNPATGCESSGNPCAPLQCKESTDECVECTADGHCDDGDECTDNRCINEECVFPPRNCNDWSFCNGVESCNPSTGCVPGTPPCPAGMICDDVFDRCVECLQDAHCNDGDPCTLDNCVNTVCSNPPRFCGDGAFCNGEEWCDSSGDCKPGSPPCPPGLCDEGDDICVACTTNSQCDDGIPCTVDSCIVGIGECNHALDNCSDGNLCTIDQCDPATGDCTNTNRCAGYGDETCEADCTCDPSTGELTLQYPCDDGNACTLDGCSDGSCVHWDMSEYCVVYACGCSYGAGCDPAIGCVYGHICADEDPCTVNWCPYDGTSDGECDSSEWSCQSLPSFDPCCASTDPCCGEYDTIEVRYKTFILPQVIYTHPWFLLYDFFKGDGRSFGSSAMPSRTSQIGQISVDPSNPTGQVGGISTVFGQSTAFDDDPDGSDVFGCSTCAESYGDWCVQPAATPDCVGTATAGQGGNVLGITYNRVSPSEVKMAIRLVGYPACTDWYSFACGIDATVDIYFKQECVDGMVQPMMFRLEGSHDGFPFHELYLNGVLTYHHSPCCTLETPYSLCGDGEWEYKPGTNDPCHSPPFEGVPLQQWQPVPGLN